PTTFTTLQLHEAAQYMLNDINDIRANPAAEAARTGVDLNEHLAPGTITTDPKQPLAPNPKLLADIEAHLNVSLKTGTYWAAPPNTMNPHNDLGDGDITARAQGYLTSVQGSSWAIAENLGATYQTGAVTDLQTVIRTMVDSLYTDSFDTGRGHRTNMLDPK